MSLFSFVCRILLALLLVMVQLVLLAIILAPLAIIYVLGIFMSGVISVWRLIEHDYAGNSDSDGEASNLAPAMDTLYYLALLQGVLFCYRFMLGRVEKKLTYIVDDSEAREVLYSYLRETRRGCDKDPSFVQGRNLTTYAVDKIGSNSPADCIYGVKILYEAIRLVREKYSPDNVTGQRMLMKHLVLCASSSRHVLQKLLEMLDSRGLNDRENRNKAAVIVEQLAPYIDLEQFPRGIQHISSLIGTFEQFSRADDHGTWYDVVDGSMEVISQLTGAQGETGVKLRREISSCAEAISTFRRILGCRMCGDELQKSAIWILTRLYMDTIGISASIYTGLHKKRSSFQVEDFVSMLAYIFTHSNEYSKSIRAYAGEALSKICFLGGISDATIVTQTSGDVVDSLTQVLLHEEKYDTCRQRAAEILEHLCTHYTKDDEYLRKLKKAILKVVGNILCCGDIRHNGKDIESLCDGKEEYSDQHKKYEGFQVDTLSSMPLNLLSPLLSLCGTVYDMRLIIDLHPQLDASTFLNKLKQIVVEKCDSTVENLSLCKATGNMVISMMKYYSSGGFFKQEDFGSLIEALSGTSKKMLDLDYSVVCSSASSSETRSKLDGRTLASLVGEAEELLFQWLLCN